MSAEAKKLLRLLDKHNELIIDAYHHNHSELIDDHESNSAIEELIALRLAWRPDDSDHVRLSGALIHLLDHGLRNSHRRHVDADIGGRLSDIEGLINNYKAATKKIAHQDALVYWRSIEEQVYDLRETLKNTTRQLWRQIASEFGYVDSLELKVMENERVLNQAKRLNDGLELVRFDELAEMAGNDIRLRRLLLKVLATGISHCQQELCDALHRLKELLFNLRKQQYQGHLIKTFYQRFQANPDFLAKMILIDTPETINQVIPMPSIAHADLLDSQQEAAFTDIIASLRKQQLSEEQTQIITAITPEFDDEMIQVEISPLKQAVNQFIDRVIADNKPLSSLASIDLAPTDCDKELWLYAIITYVHSLPASERILLQLHFKERQHPHFTGNSLVDDVTLGVA